LLNQVHLIDMFKRRQYLKNFKLKYFFRVFLFLKRITFPSKLIRLKI